MIVSIVKFAKIDPYVGKHPLANQLLDSGQYSMIDPSSL